MEKVELLPIGRGQPEGQLAQPTLMQGATARQLLENLRSRSAALDTSMVIDGEKGVIAVSQGAAAQRNLKEGLLTFRKVTKPN
jgi:hypothetical protein